MAEYDKFWQWIIAALDAQAPVALLIVVDSVGSSPGKIGDKMAVTAGDSIGTIGGGLIEDSLVEIARRLLMSGEDRPQIVRRAHYPSESVVPSGMICGGEQTALAYPCRRADRSVFAQIFESCQLRLPLTLYLSAHGLQVTPASDSVVQQFVDGEEWCYRENVAQYKRAYIIGGGHVGLALSKVLDMLDFDITVIDDREVVDTMQANAYARQKWWVPYPNIAGCIPEGSDVYVFIMTHDHQGDELVLTQLAGKRLAYLGLLGSRHKVAELRSSIVRKLTADLPQHLRAPMGLPIKSHTPAEIAISIAAELVQLHNC